MSLQKFDSRTRAPGDNQACVHRNRRHSDECIRSTLGNLSWLSLHRYPGFDPGPIGATGSKRVLLNCRPC